MYPNPFKRPNYKYYYFRYTDPFTLKRVLRSTECETKRQAYEVIKRHMDSLAGVSKEATGPLSNFLTPWLNGNTNPRYERYQLEGKQYGKWTSPKTVDIC